MAGRRPLTRAEERQLVQTIRRLSARDHALVACLWWTGFRISEVLSLKVGQVWRAGCMADRIGIAPRHLKGKRGRTRWVPILPELARALDRQIRSLARRHELDEGMPLFLSRETDDERRLRALHRCQAHRIIRRAFQRAGIVDDGRLGTHSLRKTFARRVYEHSGRDLMVLKHALGHTDVAITQKYLEVDEDAVMAAIQKTDFTRRRSLRSCITPVPTIPAAFSA